MPSNYVLLERIELNATTSSVTFANIPQTGYTDLKIVMSGRTTESYPYAGFTVAFNGSSTGFTGKDLYGIAASGAGSANRTTIYYNMDGATATANTFSNIEMYIPNYTGSTNKSFSMDAVSETNSSDNNASLIAGLWSNTAAITSITFAGNSSSFVQYSTFSLYGLAAVGTTPAIAPKASGGNVIDTDGTYWYHTFLSSGTFTPAMSLTCDYLVVAGGAGGGWDTGGGGGAGGLRSTVTATGGGGSLESALSLASGNAYTVTIGAGGAGSTAAANKGVNGSNSVFSTITSAGGGGGGSDTNASGANGGSGGGEVNANRGGVGGTGTPNQGFDGGSASGVNFNGSGGGGAGAIGIGGDAAYGGVGGAGVTTSISGTSTSYAGGGGGGSANTAGGAGGAGGGGAGGRTTPGTNGTANTGGGAGGGGASGTNPERNGGAGGSGIVIIRYTVA
jgi:hypothetical protein